MKKKSKPFVVIDKSPAFPSTDYCDERPVGSNDGMTKREYMATHILQGLCANSIPGSHHMPEERAKEAVEQADYLLKYLKQ